MDRRGGSPRDQEGIGILAGFSCAGNTVLPAHFSAEVRIQVGGTIPVQPGGWKMSGYVCMFCEQGMT